ncbi:hypothetical protein, partial [Xylanibacter rarus]|uniref:hypothetical protein n=1 Tax=Xylanibacter rarus TaxID=1676614 RepID=UPI003FF09203
MGQRKAASGAAYHGRSNAQCLIAVATATKGNSHPSATPLANGAPHISSCSKLTDTIDLAGVLYIFATILCA